MDFFSWHINIEKSIHQRPGIYILYQDQAMNKIYDRDKEGVLYIGEAQKINVRLRITKNKTYQKDYEKKSETSFAHGVLAFIVDFDEKYNLIPQGALVNGGFINKNQKLKLKYALTKSHKQIEKDLLKGHLMKYGQLPPFNTKGLSLGSVWELDKKEWEKYRNRYDDIISNL